MSSKSEHLLWVEENQALAETMLSAPDPVERRWGVVVAYYAVLHVCHAIAADRWQEHPSSHVDVRDVIPRFAPTRRLLMADMMDLHRLSERVRYLEFANSQAENWHAPEYKGPEEAIEFARETMLKLRSELLREAGL